MAERYMQVQCVYWNGDKIYFIFAEGQVIHISWQEANRLIFNEGWAAQISDKGKEN